MLFQLLTGQLPFDAPGMGELLRQVATVPAPALRQVRPDLIQLADAPWTEALGRLVADLLTKLPADRPGPAAALAARARALRDGLPPARHGPKSRG
jgi:serine/threonine-protein kinase